MDVVAVDTPELGDRSYLVHDGAVGVVVDPQRDLDRLLSEVEDVGVNVTHVFETHMHNDYVTGGLDLATRMGAAYVVSAADEVSFERTPVTDGDEILTGSLRVRAVHTPGHTFNHMAYVAVDGDGSQAVFTGGSLLFGTVGRTDLVGPQHAEALARHQYRSARRLAADVPGQASVHPTHGFGSFCASAAGSGATHSTIGGERVGNVALTTADEDEFVRTLLAGLSPYPAYYAYMQPLNRAGGKAWDLQPARSLDADEVRKRIAVGEWVIDLRNRTAFARAHVPGSVGIEHATVFSTYTGWLVPWGQPVTLVGTDPDQVWAAQCDLARIGMDDLAGASTDGPDTLTGDRRPASYPTTDFVGLAGHGLGGIVVLDVRQRDEWDAGHLPGAVHIPIQDVRHRLGEIPAGRVWVHCGSGYRASIVTSLLDNAGREVVLIDDVWDNASRAGFGSSADPRAAW